MLNCYRTHIKDFQHLQTDYSIQNSKRPFLEAIILNNIGSIYFQQQNWEKCILFSEMALLKIEKQIYAKIKSINLDILKQSIPF